MNRKAQDKLIVAAIVGIIAIILVFALLYNFYTSTKEKLAIQDCKNSIAAHSVLMGATGREVITDIKCPTRDIVVANDKEDAAKRQIADDMQRCWYEWNKGDGTYFKGDGVFCHICSTYIFKNPQKNVNGFIQYLAETPIAHTYAGDTPGVSYQDYFQGFKTPKSATAIKNANIQDLTKVDYIDASKEYTTIFVYASSKDAVDKAVEGGGRTTLATAGMFGVIGGGLAVTIGLASNPAGWIIGGVLVAGTGVAAIWKALDITPPEVVSFIVFRPYDADQLKAIGCEKSQVNEQSHTG